MDKTNQDALRRLGPRLAAGLALLGACFPRPRPRSKSRPLAAVRGLIPARPSPALPRGDTYTNAQFNDPYASALDSQSNLWVADTGNSDVEQITHAATWSTASRSRLYHLHSYHQ